MSIRYSVIAVHDIFFAMDLAANLTAIRQRIAEACARTGRQPESVTLLAVTKSQPPEVVAEAAKLGLNLFGENKVQEAKAKIPLCPGHLRWLLPPKILRAIKR